MSVFAKLLLEDNPEVARRIETEYPNNFMYTDTFYLVENTEEPEAQFDSGGGGGGKTTLEARVAQLESHMRYLATKEDIKKIKVWVLGGLLGGLPVVLLLALAIIRMFMPSD